MDIRNALYVIGIGVFFNVNTFAQETDPIAAGQDKFIGNIYSSSQVTGFTNYWNQVTPENAGKWGSVEGTRDHYNWNELDAAYNLAKNNGMPFKFHVLIWGNQQPEWIETLTSEEQLEEIEEWMDTVSNRYPDIDIVEVVNEPLHDPPDDDDNGGGNYMKALGGKGTSGWEWVIKSFELAQKYFPEAALMLNDYNIVNSAANTSDYIEIIELLQSDDLIDQIGVQAHAFTVNTTPANTIKSNLDDLAATGLPVYVTELDIDGPTDLTQVERYRRVFPVFWEHAAVEGITLWGYKPGMWRTEEMAYLIDNQGNERPALKWLRAYVEGTLVDAASIDVSAGSDTVMVDETLQFTATVVPSNATISEVAWSVAPESHALIDENGQLLAKERGTVTVTATALDGSGVTGSTTVLVYSDAITMLDDHNSSLTVYPNPTDDKFVIVKGTKPIKEVSIVDLNGNKLKSVRCSPMSSGKVDIAIDCNPGTYVLRILYGQEIVVKKITVQ